MIEYSGALAIGADEWLTVAAKDNEPSNPFTQGDPDVMTILLRIKGSDIAAFHARRATLEEVRKRVELRDPSRVLGGGLREAGANPGTRCLMHTRAVYNSLMRRLALPLLTVLALAGCGARDVTTDLEITDVHTGWFDAGIVQGNKNKIVPSVSFRIQNVSQADIATVQINAVFRRMGETASWGEHYVAGIDSTGLAPGATGSPIVLRSTLGYTGEQPRLQMLQNREFVDARVEIFGKHRSKPWVKMAEFPIDRQLLTE
jgi:hypothetical protein